MNDDLPKLNVLVLQHLVRTTSGRYEWQDWISGCPVTMYNIIEGRKEMGITTDVWRTLRRTEEEVSLQEEIRHERSKLQFQTTP